MPHLPLNCLKKHANFLLLSSALLMAMPHTSFAFGSKAPNTSTNSSSGPKSTESMTNAEKLQLIHQAISQFNQKNEPLDFLYYVADKDIFFNGTHPKTNDDCDSIVRKEITSKFAPSLDPLCRQLAPALESTLSCPDLVELGFEKLSGNTKLKYEILEECTVLSNYSGRFYAALTPKAQQLIQAGFLYLSTNTDVEYNVRAVQSALGNLILLPRQRKALDGFFGATDAFVNAINTEKANSLAGKEAKPLTHRFFAEKASLIVAYYRYLKDDFAELAQFSSANGGILKSNQEAVKVIDSAVTNLTKDYGLDSEVIARQVADYGRVLLDLLNNYSLTLTTTEKAAIQPVLVQLVTQVIPASEAYGDVGAHDAVVKLKSLWESTQFTALLTDKLSISDDKSTGLILNMSAAAYKLGLSANVDIKTFDARDVERIKYKKFN